MHDLYRMSQHAGCNVIVCTVDGVGLKYSPVHHEIDTVEGSILSGGGEGSPRAHALQNRCRTWQCVRIHGDGKFYPKARL